MKPGSYTKSGRNGHVVAEKVGHRFARLDMGLRRYRRLKAAALPSVGNVSEVMIRTAPEVRGFLTRSDRFEPPTF